MFGLCFLTSLLSLGKQTDSHSLCIILGRWRLLVLERDLGLLMFDLCSVCLISIINDNTAEGRKTHLLPKLRSLKSSLKRTMLEGTQAFSALPSQISVMCQTERGNFAKTRTPKCTLKVMMHSYYIK